MTPEETEFMEEVLAFLRETLGVPEDFLDRLETDSDWAFVITVHALIEAGLNHAIVVTLNRPELSDIIARLDTSDKDMGKVAFAKALDILSEEERKFVRMLSTLRNKLVHHVTNLNFTFSKWLTDMQPAARKSFRETLAPAVNEGRLGMSSLEFCGAHPRIAILTNLYTVMARVLVCDEKAKTARVTADLGARLIVRNRIENREPPESTPTK